MQQPKSIRLAMFYANDEEHHVTFWSQANKKWLVQSNDGVVSHHRWLHCALTDMQLRTRSYSVTDNWTVSLTNG